MGARGTYCLRDSGGVWWVSYAGKFFSRVEDPRGPLTPLRKIEQHAGIDGRGSVTIEVPDAEADGYSWGDLYRRLTAEEATAATVADHSTIAADAHAVVYGRGDNYGHPRDNHTRIAQLWTALLSDHLQDGAYITPEDVARCMVAMKLARDVNHPKRDNRVDIAGYAIALDRMETGK